MKNSGQQPLVSNVERFLEAMLNMTKHSVMFILFSFYYFRRMKRSEEEKDESDRLHHRILLLMLKIYLNLSTLLCLSTSELSVRYATYCMNLSLNLFSGEFLNVLNG